MIKNIFFDFDGVIAESVNTKTEAFREMYLPYGDDIAAKVVDYHIQNGGVSRFEKFKYFHTNFLNKSITENEVNELAKQFSAIVLTNVINAEEVPGANLFIKDFHKKLKFWVITGTPTEEIKIIAREREIEKYFVGFHGSPNKKNYWTEYLIHKFKLKREETLFIGDATTDWEAASFSKLLFALRETDENLKLFKDFNGIRFNNFDQLRIKIEKHLP